MTTGKVPAHFYWIDAMRGLAAIAVVIFHYRHFYIVDHLSRRDIPPLEAYPYAALLGPIYAHGHWAVQLFWVISGFVFAHVYSDKLVSAWQFAVARIARLYPLHVVTLLYMTLLQGLSMDLVGHWQIYGNNDLKHFVLQAFMATNVFKISQGLSFNGPIWSVSAEMGTYALFFLSLALLRRSPVFLPLILCCLGFWMGQSGIGVPVVRLDLFTCIGFFFAGSLLYGSYRSLGAYTRNILALAAGLCVMTAFSFAWGSPNTVAVFASCAIVAILAATERMIPNTAKILRPLGDISYSLYLVHVPLQATILLYADLILGGRRAIADEWWLLPVFVIICIVFAHLIYRQFERPAGKALRSRLARL